MLRMVLSSSSGKNSRVLWRFALSACVVSGLGLPATPALSANLVSIDRLVQDRAGFQNNATGEARLAALIHPDAPFRVKPPEPKTPRHLTLLMVGDTGYAPSRAKPLPKGVYKYGRWQTFKQTTQGIRHEINGDINFANMESVISASKKLRPMRKKYNFVTHPNGARHLVDIGFNLFSMANNHSFDYGQKGIRDSLAHADQLKNNGLFGHAGIGLDNAQAAALALFQANDMKIAFGAIGIGASGGGIQRATHNRPGQLSLNNKADLQLLTSNLKNADADLRLLSIHRGPERHIRPYAHEIRSVRSLVEKSRADVMIGHHAHVTRGLEIMDGRLIVYGLGNFLHQGTANMNGKNGCQNYSLIVKAHFTAKGNEAPKLAAVEALPIHSTHMQTRRLPAKQAARRISVLNGLARQFDHAPTRSRGVRFMTQSDGSGLFCTPAAQNHPDTRHLCSNFSPVHLASDRHYSRALSSCGRVAPKLMVALADKKPVAKAVATKPVVKKPVLKKLVKTVSITQDQIQDQVEKTLKAVNIVPERKPVIAKLQEKAPPKPENIILASVEKSVRLVANPKHWPVGMPLAWQVPTNETSKQKHRRWGKKRYSIAEVEKLLRKRGLIR